MRFIFLKLSKTTNSGTVYYVYDSDPFQGRSIKSYEHGKRIRTRFVVLCLGIVKLNWRSPTSKTETSYLMGLNTLQKLGVETSLGK